MKTNLIKSTLFFILHMEMLEEVQTFFSVSNDVLYPYKTALGIKVMIIAMKIRTDELDIELWECHRK